MSTYSLPANASLTQLKNLAKDLHRAHGRGEVSACERIAIHFPKLSGASIDAVRTARFGLQDAQLVIAREHGFSSWSSLKQRVERLAKLKPTDVPEPEVLWDTVAKLFHKAGVKRWDDCVSDSRDLLSRGADPNVVRYEMTPLSIAASVGHLPLLELLLEWGADVSIADADSPYDRAARRGDESMMAMLRKHGAKPSLRAAAMLGESATIAQALTNGAVPADELLQLLEAAAVCTQHDVVDQVLPLVPDINAYLDADKKNKARNVLHIVADQRAPENPEALEAMMRKLIAAGAKVTIPDWNGVTALHRAVRARNVGMVRILLEAGADPNVKDRGRGSTPIWRAIANTGAGHTAGLQSAAVDITKLLLEHGADPHTTNKQGKRPIDSVRNPEIRALLENAMAEANADGALAELTGRDSDFGKFALAAAGRGDLEAIKAYLKAKPEWLNHRGSHGRSLLWEASWRGKLDVVQYLADAGADIHAPGCHYTPLKVEVSPYCAARYKGRTDVAVFLRSRGASNDLYTASYLGDETRVRELLEAEPAALEEPCPQVSPHRWPDGTKGAPTYATPLCYAVCGKQLTVVKQLLALGAEVAAHSRHLLKYADENVALIRILLEHGAKVTDAPVPEDPNSELASLLKPHGVVADVNFAEDGKWPPLVYLCRGDRGGNPQEVKALLAKGADLEVRNYKGKTALQVAAKAGLVPAMEVLLQSGANPNALDPQGETALFDVCRSTIRRQERKLAAVRLLLKHGLDAEIRNDRGQRALDVAKGDVKVAIASLLDA